MDRDKMISAYGDDALGTHDGVELARLIAGKEIQASEAVEAAIARARRVNPRLNAVAVEAFEQAMSRAEDPKPGAFSGVPSFIKDSEDVKSLPTLFGSRSTPQKPMEKSGKFVEQYNAAGFINIGKSTLPEFGLTAATESLANGPTRNPWHHDYSPGGSSGGAAALVAAGVVPIAHGNDGAGSIRIPAACCGLVGLKPSQNRLLNEIELEQLPINLVCQGVLSRTVRDTAAFYAAAEKYYRNPNLPEIGLVQHPGKQRLRIGLFTRAYSNVSIDSDYETAVLEAGKVCEELGHNVQEIPFPLKDQVAADFWVYWGLLAFYIQLFGKKFFGKEFEKKKMEQFTKELSRYFRKNLLRVPFVIKRLRKFAQQYVEVFNQYDILLSPALSHPPPKHGYLGPEVPFDIAMDRVSKFIPFTPVQNISGTPAISLPLGRNQSGLPLGVQFAAAVGQEKQLIEIAFEMEEAKPWPRIDEA